ncbi:MAG: PspC domain-containing protein [Bacteroidales bacterium]|nr:PspC domain-containing protein [Bacteroidales bacterium]
MTQRRLTKSNDKMLSGVLAGIAEYFDIDPTVVRLVYAMFTLFTGLLPCLLTYLILAIIVPPSNN